MMTDKVAIFSDLHLGLKQDSPVWHEIALNWCKWFVDEVKKREIDTIVFLGDFFHTRNNISANTLHVASKVLDMMKDFKLHIILGNHDLYYANEPTVSPVNLFQGRNNITVYTKPEKVDLYDGCDAVFCGWGYNPLDFRAKILFTHAEINIFRYNTDIDTCNSGHKASDLTSNYDLVYSGHFHLKQEKKWNNKRISYVGNPFSMDHSDNYQTLKGFDILDLKTLESEFVENTISPKFYKVYLSELVSGKWSYDELNKVIDGNIFKVIIDLNITPADINILNGLISQYKPLEYALEWENGKNFSQEISEVELKVFDMEEAIQKYIELLDIPNKAEVTEYVLRLYEKAQS